MRFALAATLTFAASAAHADVTPQATLDRENVPPALQARGEAAGLWTDHAIDFSINPFYLRGDFDGDRKADYVVGVTKTGATDVELVILRARGKPIWIDTKDLPARDAWYVVDRTTKIGKGAAGGKPPRLKSDAILIAKAESSSALVYWKGKKLATYWQAD